MLYRIRSIDLYAREIPAPRIDFTIGQGHSLFPDWMRINVEVRLILESADGRSAWGCSADWPSFGWLDKRPDRNPKDKLHDLLQLVMASRDVFLEQPVFETPFDCWWSALGSYLVRPETAQGVSLCGSFSIALIERAVIDAFCRIENLPFHQALRQNRLGFRPERIHPELSGYDISRDIPDAPLETVFVRHTIGISDPLTGAGLPPGNRVDDGLPFTLEEYVKSQGISWFKIKTCGDGERDLNRLAEIWKIIGATGPTITLDGNEACEDPASLERFLDQFAARLPDMYSRVQFVEQPMSRSKTHDDSLAGEIARIARKKPLVIDEADGYLHAFRDAAAIGYQGVSHKNCKGIFKSLANFALCQSRSRKGKSLFVTAEDLTNMPVTALQQDFAVISALGLTHAERNGHHFFCGLNHLQEKEQSDALRYCPKLYRQENGQTMLRVDRGRVDISGLSGMPGLGVADEPDWRSMTPLETWVGRFRKEHMTG